MTNKLDASTVELKQFQAQEAPDVMTAGTLVLETGQTMGMVNLKNFIKMNEKDGRKADIDFIASHYALISFIPIIEVYTMLSEIYGNTPLIEERLCSIKKFYNS